MKKKNIVALILSFILVFAYAFTVYANEENASGNKTIDREKVSAVIVTKDEPDSYLFKTLINESICAYAVQSDVNAYSLYFVHQNNSVDFSGSEFSSFFTDLDNCNLVIFEEGDYTFSKDSFNFANLGSNSKYAATVDMTDASITVNGNGDIYAFEGANINGFSLPSFLSLSGKVYLDGTYIGYNESLEEVAKCSELVSSDNKYGVVYIAKTLPDENDIELLADTTPIWTDDSGNKYYSENAKATYDLSKNRDKGILAYLFDTDSDGTGDTYVITSTSSINILRNGGWWSKFPWNVSDDVKGCAKLIVFRDKVVGSEDYSHFFRDCSNLIEVRGLENIDFANTTNMEAMFANCPKLTAVDVSSFDIGNVTIMYNMFGYSSNLQSIDLSSWTGSKVTTVHDMFAGCGNLKTVKIGTGFDTSNVTDFTSMFYRCYNLESVDLENIKTDSATVLACMFDNNQKLATMNIANWNVSKCTNFGGMFNGCSKVAILDVSKWDTSAATNMDHMFYACSSVKSYDFSKWNTAKCTNMAEMFNRNSSVTLLDLSSFDTSKVENMVYMFRECGSLKEIKGQIDTSSCTNLNHMFSWSTSLTTVDLSKFNTSKCTDFSYMFEKVPAETIDISSFTVSENANTKGMFLDASYVKMIDLKGFQSIGEKAFENCNALRKLKNMDSIKSITSGAFYRNGSDYYTHVYGCTNSVVTSYDWPSNGRTLEMPKKDIQGRIFWCDYFNQDDTRPDNVEFEVYRNGKLFKSMTENAPSDITWEYWPNINENGEGSSSKYRMFIKNAPQYDKEGDEYSYSIKLKPINNYGIKKDTFDVVFDNYSTNSCCLEYIATLYSSFSSNGGEGHKIGAIWINPTDENGDTISGVTYKFTKIESLNTRTATSSNTPYRVPSVAYYDSNGNYIKNTGAVSFTSNENPMLLYLSCGYYTIEESGTPVKYQKNTDKINLKVVDGIVYKMDDNNTLTKLPYNNGTYFYVTNDSNLNYTVLYNEAMENKSNSYEFIIPHKIVSFWLNTDKTLKGEINNTGKLIITGTGTTLDIALSDALPSGTKLTGIDFSGAPNLATIGSNWCYNQTNLGNFVIPNTVTTIENYAFSYSGGTSLTLPDKIKTIGDSAFSNWKSAGSNSGLTIPDSVTSIGENAFSGSTWTGSLNIGRGLTEIPKRAFYKVEGFTGDLNIPGNVTSIGEDAFGYAGERSWVGNKLILNEGLVCLQKNAFYCCSGFRGDLVIPDTVEDIGEMAFVNNRNSQNMFNGNLVIGSSVRTIGERAFYNLRTIGNLTIPNSVETIGESAFSQASFTGKLTLSNKMTYIERDTFSYLPGIVTIEGGNKITKIAYGAFGGLSSTVETSLNTDNDVLYNYTWKRDNRSIVNKKGDFTFAPFLYFDSIARQDLKGFESSYDMVTSGSFTLKRKDGGDFVTDDIEIKGNGVSSTSNSITFGIENENGYYLNIDYMVKNLPDGEYIYKQETPLVCLYDFIPVVKEVTFKTKYGKIVEISENGVDTVKSMKNLPDNVKTTLSQTDFSSAVTLLYRFLMQMNSIKFESVDESGNNVPGVQYFIYGEDVNGNPIDFKEGMYKELFYDETNGYSFDNFIDGSTGGKYTTIDGHNGITFTTTDKDMTFYVLVEGTYHVVQLNAIENLAKNDPVDFKITAYDTENNLSGKGFIIGNNIEQTENGHVLKMVNKAVITTFVIKVPVDIGMNLSLTGEKGIPQYKGSGTVEIESYTTPNKNITIVPDTEITMANKDKTKSMIATVTVPSGITSFNNNTKGAAENANPDNAVFGNISKTYKNSMPFTIVAPANRVSEYYEGKLGFTISVN